MQEIKKGQVWYNIHNNHKVTIDDVEDDSVYFVGSYATDTLFFIDNWKIESKESNETPKYYNNEKGSIYQFCNEQGLNSYEFDIIKRIVRCRKKGLFAEDLQKTKNLIDLYLKEFNH